ncbi:hypothetical protein NBRC110019_26460 [Neptunitalea chrysea]|uniref:Uncharacterized protein n=1 Tax=Neptunitalea chrysea TaxID=1647581 RepID=A0A9W6B6S7_9FLAO|nr:hypothetical protein [Neptunitalea chrysea]GLB53605.1 hypothetical protein NBRC110019_26460 [Neptunitalea chrysea]
MDAKNYLDDITQIKQMMNKSSRFISLSGLSGVMAGIYALIGAFVAHYYIEQYLEKLVTNEVSRNSRPMHLEIEFKLLVIAALIMLAAIVTGVILTSIKAKKNNAKMWDASSRRLLINFAFPLITGGLFCLILIQRNYISLIAPTMLIFYGLACINASKFTIGDIKYLGVINVITGIICSQYIGYGIYFWAFGFGVMHIVYGTIMYLKYDRK